MEQTIEVSHMILAQPSETARYSDIAGMCS